MTRVMFYKNEKGVQPVAEFIRNLAERKDKTSRINLNKIRDYIRILELYGTNIGEPYTKHIVDKIWELRPLRNRILFVVWYNDTYILLHCFIKKTQKTPRREIEKAQKELENIIKRSENNGKR